MPVLAPEPNQVVNPTAPVKPRAREFWGESRPGADGRGRGGRGQRTLGESTPRHKSFYDMRKRRNAESGNSRRRALTGLAAEIPQNEKAPRVTQYANRGLGEVGAYTTNKLRQRRHYLLYPWNPIPARLDGKTRPTPPPRDRLRLAHYYQSLLDSGKFESRAALARFLGVSRARVTQVLNRLKELANHDSTDIERSAG